MFKFIKDFIVKIDSISSDSHNDDEETQTHIEYDYDKEKEGDPLLNINFMLTTEGFLFIDLQNTARKVEADELATVINYISSYRGQLDVLEIIKTNLSDSNQKELYDEFVQHFIKLKANEASLLDERKEEDSSPYINPSEMLP
tara:strand:- start:126 stop:554 length:429 start_codon:yes stop_codon:yes gene_type:complete